MEDELVLVDENDNCIGTLPKRQAHEDGGVLHRAFSIFIFDSAQRMLLQLRGKDKYHFGGRWTNACCSHPRRGEELQEAAHRRLREELGFDVPLQELFSFTYRAYDEKSGLTEHEFDHVFIGHYDGVPQPNPQEVDDWKWVSISELEDDLTQHPDQYTAWFRLSVTQVCNSLEAKLKAQ
ncbi:MAG TPA: isopentenyl-diphosphate Delta-isomerase [Abditibacteriaceae bacterium]|jgi:isopentenyl-diphosphate delta-isomerase